MCARSKCEEAAKVAADAKTLRKLRRQAMTQHSAALRQPGKDLHVLSPKQDAIALATAQYRTIMLATCSLVAEIQASKLYKVLLGSTQPAHVVSLVAVVTIAAIVMPQGQATAAASHSDGVKASPMMSFIYLAAFTIHYGAQMWMTFISGLTLYFALPRHTFGGVQHALFPKYFTLNSFLSLVTLIVFVKIRQSSKWDAQVFMQVCAMIICFLLELMIRLYLTPPLLHLMAAKNAMEKAAGVGLEVGCHSVGSLAMCPHYIKIHKAFRNIHMTVAIGNMLAMASTTFHLYYLSNKIYLT